MNRHERRKTNARLPKEDIVFMKVDFDSLDQHADVLKLLHSNYTAINYPFGYGKVKYSSPIKNDDRYFMVATVKLTIFEYMHKCALSHSEVLQQACSQWVKAYHPQYQSAFYDLVEYHKVERAKLMAKHNLER